MSQDIAKQLVREQDINSGLLDMTKSIQQDRDVPHIPSQSFEDYGGEGFHVNSSWTVPSLLLLVLRKLKCFKHALLRIGGTGGMF